MSSNLTPSANSETWLSGLKHRIAIAGDESSEGSNPSVSANKESHERNRTSDRKRISLWQRPRSRSDALPSRASRGILWLMKIVITIEDQPGDKVKITSIPTFETMAKMINSGEESTSAMGYAMQMVNVARKESKSKDPETKIWLPKVQRL